MSEAATAIRARCIEDGDCLLWQGPTSHSGVPVMDTKKKVSVRRALYEAEGGKAVQGMVFPSLCGNRLCVCHTKPVTQSQARKIAARQGAYKSRARVVKRTLTLRANSRYSEEDIQTIREAESAAEACRLTGVSVAYAHEIRNGNRRAPLVTHFSGLGAR